MSSPVAELLIDLAHALNGAGIDWYLFGAQAAILHGSARLTADVDVTVRLEPSVSNENLAGILEHHRFLRQIADSAFTARTRVIPFVHVPTTLPLDVVLAGPGLEDQFFERAQSREVEGASVRLASPEDLIVMKVLAGRPKDIEDIIAIDTVRAEQLDVAYIEQTLAMLESALGQSDLRPLYHRIRDPRQR